MTACELTTTSEAVVMEPPRAGGLLESCGTGDSAASLDDVIVDTAKYVNTNLVKEFVSACRSWRISVSFTVLLTNLKVRLCHYWFVYN